MQMKQKKKNGQRLEKQFELFSGNIDPYINH